MSVIRIQVRTLILLKSKEMERPFTEPDVVLKENDVLMVYAKSNLINDLILKLSNTNGVN